MEDTLPTQRPKDWTYLHANLYNGEHCTDKFGEIDLTPPIFLHMMDGTRMVFETYQQFHCFIKALFPTKQPPIKDTQLYKDTLKRLTYEYRSKDALAMARRKEAGLVSDPMDSMRKKKNLNY